MRIAAQDEPNLEQLQVLAERLESSLLIAGTVTSVTDTVRGGRNTPLLAVTVRMIDGQTGEELVTTFHRRDGEEYRSLMQFGVVHSMSELAKLVSQEVIEKWKTNGELRCIQ